MSIIITLKEGYNPCINYLQNTLNTLFGTYMEIISLALIGLLIVISPGADFVLVLKNSMTSGRISGVWTALGISLAIGVHISYSMLGISYLISQNELIFSFVKYAGAAYLMYLGIKGILTANASLEAIKQHKNKLKPSQYIIQGFLCNLLNPKTMLFFISLFSQLISSDSSNQFLVLLYGLYIALLHGLWFSLVALLFTSNVLKNSLFRMKKRINQTCGIGLLAFGAILAFRA